MVACHLNFQFQVLALLKGTKEFGMAHFTVDASDFSKVLSHFSHHKRIWLVFIHSPILSTNV
jgi:hypothetical protein